MDRVNTLLIEPVLNDIGKNFFDGDEEVIAELTADVVLGGKAFKNRIHPQQVFDPVFYSYLNFGIFHTEERMSD